MSFNATRGSKPVPPPSSMDVATETFVELEAYKEREKKVRAPTKPAAPLQDIETILGIAERLYHLPGGKNGKGVVGQTCARLREWLEKIK